MKCRVIENWAASYADPIQIRKGEAVALDGRRDIWDGHCWLWAKASDGREGWIPDDILDDSSGATTAKEDYSAKELSCQAGQVLTVIKETHGWVLLSGLRQERLC